MADDRQTSTAEGAAASDPEGTAPTWCDRTSHSPEDLRAVLTVAANGNAHHTDCFFRHRDTVIKQLGAIVTAELVICTFLTFLREAKPGAVIATGVFVSLALLFVFLALLSPVIALAGIRSCRRSYRSALENAMAVNKLVWLLTSTDSPLSKQVEGKTRVVSSLVPLPGDLTVYVPRFMQTALSSKYKTTDDVCDALICKWPGLIGKRHSLIGKWHRLVGKWHTRTGKRYRLVGKGHTRTDKWHRLVGRGHRMVGILHRRIGKWNRQIGKRPGWISNLYGLTSLTILLLGLMGLVTAVVCLVVICYA